MINRRSYLQTAASAALLSGVGVKTASATSLTGGEGVKVANDWGELKTVVEGAGRGDVVTVPQGDHAVLAYGGEQIHVPNFVAVDLGRVELNQIGGEDDLWRVGAGSFINTGHVLPLPDWNGTLFEYPGAEVPYREWLPTATTGSIKQDPSGSGQPVVHDMSATAGGERVVNVRTSVDGVSPGTYIRQHTEGGYINGNFDYGTAAGFGLVLDQARDGGDISQNSFLGSYGGLTSGRTDIVLDIAGNYNVFNAQIWDLGIAMEAGIRFQPGSVRNIIYGNHPSIDHRNMIPGGDANYVYNLANAVAYHDAGDEFKILRHGALGYESDASTTVPDGSAYPKGTFIELADGSVWLNGESSPIQVV